jgi:type IV pilus assembly protein PilE
MMSGSCQATSGWLCRCKVAAGSDNRDMHHASSSTRRRAGFTLIELMIVVGVVGVLAIVAYPSFQESVRKSRRADAIAGLNKLQQLQERVRGQQPSYADAVAAMPGPPPATSPERHYVLAVTAASANGYSMRATASDSSPQFGDTKCRALQVAMDRGTITTSSLNAAGDLDTANANHCWPR